MVVGETPNLTARLQAFVEPGQIVLAGVTHRLVGAQFRVRDLGQQPVKSFVEAPRRRLTDLVGLATEVQAVVRDASESMLKNASAGRSDWGIGLRRPRRISRRACGPCYCRSVRVDQDYTISSRESAVAEAFEIRGRPSE